MVECKDLTGGTAICNEIAGGGGDLVPITGLAWNCLTPVRPQVSPAVFANSARWVIVTTEGQRGVNVFALAYGWRNVTDPDEVKRIASDARQTPKRKPRSSGQVRSRKHVEVPVVKVEPEPEQPRVRPISLPVLAWPTPAGLRLLAENP